MGLLSGRGLKGVLSQSLDQRVNLAVLAKKLILQSGQKVWDKNFWQRTYITEDHFCGKNLVGKIWWEQFCGKISVEKFLWKKICGKKSVGKILWKNFCGKISVEKNLWKKICGISKSVENNFCWSLGEFIENGLFFKNFDDNMQMRFLYSLCKFFQKCLSSRDWMTLKEMPRVGGGHGSSHKIHPRLHRIKSQTSDQI